VRRRFLALGDSYTIGEGVAESERWPVRLAQRLRAAAVEVGDPTIVATTGWTTGELAEALERAAPPPPFDLVTLLVGVNDQYRGCGLAAYAASLPPLVRRAVELAGGAPARLLVLSIPDWSVTPFAGRDPRGATAIATEIDRFNALAAQEARTVGAEWVDVTEASRAAAHDRMLLAPDGLHPSGSLYERWVELILPAARRALAR
jgi:lysophospholipase L1-like esterase